VSKTPPTYKDPECMLTITDMFASASTFKVELDEVSERQIMLSATLLITHSAPRYFVKLVLDLWSSLMVSLPDQPSCLEAEADCYRTRKRYLNI
jgi:hypothetical protein